MRNKYDEDAVIKHLTKKKKAFIDGKVISFNLLKINMNPDSCLGNKTQGKLDYMRGLGYSVVFYKPDFDG